MVRVGVRGSLLAGVSAAAILAFAVRPSAAEDTAALSPSAGPAPPSADDYYTRRAKRTLEDEKRAVVEPHPLAAYYPGMDIVVCEAGCTTGSGAQVVAARKRDEPVVKSEGFMVATSANAAPESAATDASTDVACIAGCYGETDNRPLPRRATPHVRRMALPPRDQLSPVR
jgi:hypothetical protein